MILCLKHLFRVAQSIWLKKISSHDMTILYSYLELKKSFFFSRSF